MKVSERRNIRKSYFINAARKIIENEGIDAITARKVSQMAGYDASTLYNYFENLDHIIFLASISFIKDYTTTLQTNIKECNSYVERYIKIWDSFCHYSFERPEIYYRIFYSKLNSSLKNKIEEYYDIYPEELPNESKYLQDMLRHQNMYDRGATLLKPCVEEGSILAEDLNEINEIHILIYKGILSRVMNKDLNSSVEEIRETAMNYIIKSLYMYVDKSFYFILDKNFKGNAPRFL